MNRLNSDIMPAHYYWSTSWQYDELVKRGYKIEFKKLAPHEHRVILDGETSFVGRTPRLALEVAYKNITRKGIK